MPLLGKMGVCLTSFHVKEPGQSNSTHNKLLQLLMAHIARVGQYFPNENDLQFVVVSAQVGLFSGLAIALCENEHIHPFSFLFAVQHTVLNSLNETIATELRAAGCTALAEDKALL